MFYYTERLKEKDVIAFLFCSLFLIHTATRPTFVVILKMNLQGMPNYFFSIKGLPMQISCGRRTCVRHRLRLHDDTTQQESHAVAGKPRDAAVNSDRYRVCWHLLEQYQSVECSQSVDAPCMRKYSMSEEAEEHVLLRLTYLLACLLTAYYYYNSRCVQCGT